MKIHYKQGSADDGDVIENGLEVDNKKQCKVIQQKDYKKFIVTATMDNKIIGGGIAYSSLYYIGYLDTLWVEESYRGSSIGFKHVGKKLKEYGCELCHLETFDFQAPGFYEKNGYEEFGRLNHKKNGITEFFMKKDL